MFDLRNCNGADTPFTTTNKLSKIIGEEDTDLTQYRRVIGGLQCVVLTRLDIAHVVNRLSQFMANLLQPHWMDCKGVLRYLKETIDFGLIFKKSDSLDLIIYSDAD